MADRFRQWHGGLVDPTLTREGVPADAKAAGEVIDGVKKSIKEIQDSGISSEYIDDAIGEYLKDNPIEGVTKRELTEAVEGALQDAKDSGEFDGKDGAPGKDGEQGTTFTPSVSEDGTLSWSNDGGLANPNSINVKGPMPVKGTDYWTEADKQEIVNDLIRDEISDAVEERISTITNGVTEGNEFAAEVVSARTDEDGVVHTSLKTRIDSGISSLKDTKADAITNTSERAASHELYAQADSPLRITLYGKTTERGTGDKSPDNPYVISGIDTATLYVGDEEYELPFLPEDAPLLGDGEIDDTVENDALVDGKRKCRVTRRWKIVTLDGTQTMSLITVQGGTEYRMQIRLDGLSASTNATVFPRGGCGGLPTATANDNYRKVESISFGGEYAMIYIAALRNATLEEWKAYLAASPLEVYYPLATPEIYVAERVEIKKAKTSESDAVRIHGSGETSVDYLLTLEHYADSKMEEAVDQFKNIIGYEQIGPITPDVRRAGQYIDPKGAISNSANFNVFEAVKISKGSKVTIYARGYVENVAILSRTDSEQSVYTPVVVSIDSEARTYTYEVEETGWYATCSWNNVESTYQIETNALSERIGNAEVAIENLGSDVLAMFNTVVCIGDSLTYSQVMTSASESRQAYQPYPKVLEKRTGTKTETYAHPGDTPTSWWNRFNAECMVERNNTCYIVYLGTNGNGLTDTIADDCPAGSDMSTWANTHTGYYGRILQSIANLGAKAILVKVYYAGSSANVETTNGVIDQFGERFGFPVVENRRLTDAALHYYPDKSGSNTVHYNDVGYVKFADQLLKNIAGFSSEQLAMLIPN